MSRKIILHIAEPFATGVLSFLVDITIRQVDEYEIYILWGERPLTPSNVVSLFDPRIHLIKIDAFKGALGSVLNPGAYLSVRKWFDEIKPDFVHMHSSASGFVGRWALPLRRVKAFYTPHGYSFLMSGGLPLKKWMFFLLEWVTAFRPALTVACGSGEYREAVKLPGKKTYVTNGIRTEGMDEFVNYVPANDSPVIVTSGRILKQKNPHFFNKVAELIPEARFVWIGSGELENELSAGNITVTGWITRQEALKIISDSHFFILTSLWEGLPLCLLEAMYLKKMCLATDVIGNNDAIQDGINGLLCQNPEDMASKIRDCLAGRYEVKKIVEAAHADIVENYGIDKMAEAYKRLYEG